MPELTQKEIDALVELAKVATKAPWRISDFELKNGGDNRCIIGGDEYSVAYISERHGAENHANAVLMQHAPRLLSDLVNARKALVEERLENY